MIRFPFQSRIRSISRSESARSIASSLIVGLFITLGQIALVVVVINEQSMAESWSDGLVQWDSRWYHQIAERGYVKLEKMDEESLGSFRFPPGFPLLSRFISKLTGLNLHVSLIVTAQLCCWGFWIYFLLLLREARASCNVQVFAVGLIALHPVSFFLIAAYSESLFLFSLFGFIYWVERPGPSALIPAAIHGFLMTATRFVGITLIVYPLIRALVRRNWGRNQAGSSAAVSYGSALLVGMFSAAGLASYLAYCQWEFGNWNLFSISHRVSCGIDPYPLALLDPRVFYDAVSTWNEVLLDPVALNALCAGYCFLLSIGLVLAEIAAGKKARLPGLGWRIGIYVCAMFLFALPYTSHGRVQLLSFSRFSLPVIALLTLAGAHLAAESGIEKRWRWLAWILGTLLLLSAVANGLMTTRFTSGAWVA